MHCYALKYWNASDLCSILEGYWGILRDSEAYGIPGDTGGYWGILVVRWLK